MSAPVPTDAAGIAAYFLATQLGASEAVAGAVTGIYKDHAPEGTPPPYVVFAYTGDNDINQLGPYRTGNRRRYEVQAVTTGESDVAIGAIIHAVDMALQGQALTLSEPGQPWSGVWECLRQSAGESALPLLGKEYRQLSGFYDVYVTEPTT